MRDMGLRGVGRGRAWQITTQSAPTSARPTDLVDRRFTAMRPNQLWVADFTYVATWRGFVYVAFVTLTEIIGRSFSLETKEVARLERLSPEAVRTECLDEHEGQCVSLYDHANRRAAARRAAGDGLDKRSRPYDVTLPDEGTG